MINYKNTFGAEIRNKLSTISIAEELIREKIKDPLQSINMMFDNTEELLNNIQSAIEELKDLADKLKDMPIEPAYKDLGCENGFHNSTPEEYVKCHELKHATEQAIIGNCLTEFRCPICKIKWTCDSSD